MTQLHETVHELELVRFLLARVDDDEAELKKLARQHSRGTGPSTLQGPRSLERLRAECTSKRQIIGALQQLFVLRDQPFEKQIRDAAAAMLQSLAMPYSGHAGYRKHWEAVAV